jgi:hypothetical protein
MEISAGLTQLMAYGNASVSLQELTPADNSRMTGQ